MLGVTHSSQCFLAVNPPEAHGKLGENVAPWRSTEQLSQWAGLPVTCRDHGPRQGTDAELSTGSGAVLPASRSPDARLPAGLAWQLRGPAGGAHAMWEPPAPFSLNAPRVPASCPALTPEAENQSCLISSSWSDLCSPCCARRPPASGPSCSRFANTLTQRLTSIPLLSPFPLISSKNHLSPREANTWGRPSLQSEQLSSVQKWQEKSSL